ncbi:MAG: hypothetical protein ACXABY_17270, partial [Candidatus Thorarchaeota archaeon]
MTQLYGGQNDFTSGEVTPRFYGRFDLPQYAKGAQKIQNFSVYPQGGLSRRMGTERLDDAYDETNPTRLIKFSKELEQQFQIELGHDVIQVRDLDGVVQETFTSNVYDSSFIWDVTASVIDDAIWLFHPLHKARILSFDGTTHTLSLYAPVNGPILAESSTDKDIILSISSNTYQVRLTSDNASAFNSVAVNDWIEWYEDGEYFVGQVDSVDPDATKEYAIVNPANSIAKVDPTTSFWASSPDIEASKTGVFNSQLTGSYVRFYDANNGLKPTWIALNQFQGLRVDTGSWVNGTSPTFVEYMDYSGTTIYEAAGGSRNLWSLDNEAANIPGIVSISDEVNTLTIKSNTAGTFSSNEVDRALRLMFGTLPYNCTISAYVNSQEVTCTSEQAPLYFGNNYVNQGRATQFFRGAHYGLDGTATASYSFCGGYFQQRAIFSGTATHPDHVFYTVSGDIFDHALTDLDGDVLATSAFSAKVAGSFSRTRWIVSSGSVILGNEDGEWVLDGGDEGVAVTPSNTRITQQSTRGSIIPPVKIGTNILYIQKSGARMYEMEYDLRKRSQGSLDISILSEHLLRENGSSIIDIDYAQEPYSQLWLVRSDGKIIALTYNKDQDVFAWHKHVIADESGDAFVESVSTSIASDLTQDYIYLVVKRGTKRWIERVAKEFNPANNQDKEDMAYLDGFTKITAGLGSTTVAVPTIYNGSTVNVVVDGANHPAVEVSAGSITLQQTATNWVYIGYNYTSLLQLLPFGIVTRTGPLFGKLMRTYAVLVKTLNSVGFRVGENLT